MDATAANNLEERDIENKIDSVTSKIGKALNGGEFIETPFDQPFEEEQRGDPDQRDDDQNFSGERIARNLEGILKKDVHSVIHQERIKFFLDGSLRTKFLGEYVNGDNTFPILAAEVACATMKKSLKELESAAVVWRLEFIFPHKDTGLVADTQYEKLKAIGDTLMRSKSPFRIEFLQKTEVRDVRYSMQGKARDIMHSLEHEVANLLTRNKNEWLIMDGAIRKAEFLTLKDTIGVAKSFSRKPLFQVGNNIINITKYLSQIKEGERSAIFRMDSAPDVAFWYIRLRTFPPMEPLGGFVKIDLKLADDSVAPDDIALIDQISSEIFSIRNPSVYPYPRWPSFLYPIRVAEETMQSTFLNEEMLGLYGHMLKQAME